MAKIASYVGNLLREFCHISVYYTDDYPLPTVRTCVRPSLFCFQMITGVNINGFSPNLVCALILWRSGLGLLMGNFRQISMEFSVQDMPIFSFLDDNLSKHHWIFTKLGMCIDIVEIWFLIANGQFSSNFDGVST